MAADAGDLAVLPSLSRLQADLFVLMTRYATRPDPRVAEAVVGRLETVASHPLFVLLTIQERRAVARLAQVWRGCQAEPVGHGNG
jgi:hypothetical protein